MISESVHDLGKGFPAAARTGSKHPRYDQRVQLFDRCDRRAEDCAAGETHVSVTPQHDTTSTALESQIISELQSSFTSSVRTLDGKVDDDSGHVIITACRSSWS